MSKCYHFESAEKLCKEFNTLVNELKKDDKVSEKVKYPWLEDSDDRKYMTDREILGQIYRPSYTMFDRLRKDRS